MGDFDAKARTWDVDPAKVERARRVAQAIAQQVSIQPWMTLLGSGQRAHASPDGVRS